MHSKADIDRLYNASYCLIHCQQQIVSLVKLKNICKYMEISQICSLLPTGVSRRFIKLIAFRTHVLACDTCSACAVWSMQSKGDETNIDSFYNASHCNILSTVNCLTCKIEATFVNTVAQKVTRDCTLAVRLC